MGTEWTNEAKSLSNLESLLSSMSSPEDNSGTRTPPIHTTASVPFRWEEQPGKPHPCTALIPFPISNNNKFLQLQLPPRLLQLPPAPADSKLTSPTTVLDQGPGSSRRFKGSFEKHDYQTGRAQLGDMVLIKNRGKEKTGFFRFRRMGKKSNNHGEKVEDDDDDDNGDVGLSFFKEDDNEIIKMRRNGSFKTSSFLAILCEEIKQVMIPLKMRTTTLKKKKIS